MKKDIFYFNEVLLNTDYGWIFKDKQIISLIGLEKLTTDILNIDQDSNNNVYYRTLLYFSKSQKVFNREYVKIQKLAAEVGGILQVFILFARMVTEYYNNIYFHYDLIENFISENEIEKFKNKYSSEVNYTSTLKINESLVKILDSSEKKISENLNKPNLNNFVKTNAQIKNTDYKSNLDVNNQENENIKEINLNQEIQKNNYDRSNKIFKSVRMEEIDNSEITKKIELIHEKVKTRKSKIKRNENYFISIIPFSNFFWFSTPSCFNHKKSKYEFALYKSTEDYFNSTISIETLLDSRNTLNQIKEIVFSDDQINLINFSPNKQYEKYFSKVFERLEAIRNNEPIENLEHDKISIENVIKNAETNSVNFKIIKLYD